MLGTLVYSQPLLSLYFLYYGPVWLGHLLAFISAEPSGWRWRERERERENKIVLTIVKSKRTGAKKVAGKNHSEG